MDKLSTIIKDCSATSRNIGLHQTVSEMDIDLLKQSIKH